MRYIILITYLSYLNPYLLTKLSIVFQNSSLQMVLACSTLLPPHIKFLKLCILSSICKLTFKGLHQKFKYVVKLDVISKVL